MEGLKPPQPIKLRSGNISDSWTRFKEQFEWYLQAVSAADANDARKIGLFLTVAGPEAQELYRTFSYETGEDKTKYDTVLSKFETFCTPKRNDIFERYKFRMREQEDGESFEQFLTDLRLKADSCSYGTLKNDMIRDQIVIGIKNHKLRERLLRQNDLTLADAITMCLAQETTEEQLKVFDQSEAKVSAVRSKPKPKGSWKPNEKKKHFAKREQSQSHDCGRCGFKHPPKKCPAWGKNCTKCKGKNHFAAKCRSGKLQAVVIDGEGEQGIDFEFESEDFFVHSVNQFTNRDRFEWIAPVDINGTVTPLKIDSGAQVNVLTWADYNSLDRKPQIYDSKMQLKAYNNTHIRSRGICYATVQMKSGRKFNGVRFVIVDGNNGVTQSILGVGDSERFGLVVRARDVYKVCVVKPKANECETNSDSSYLTKGQITREYRDIFKGLGCLDGKVSIHLKDDAKPIVCPARKVPIALRDKLKTELNRLEKQGVIEKTKGPTDWVLPLVLVEKANGSLRICMDPLRLNQYVKREHFHLPERSEIQSEMAGAKYFSKLDASQGFYHIQLDNQSSRLCTVATPFGRYSFKRMPFGVSCAPEIFHAKIAQLFENMDGVKVSMDDIIVYAKTRDEHDRRLRKVLQIIRKAGIRLNMAKCEIGVLELTFVGDRLSSDGVRPDPKKVAAITNMPDPACKEDLQRALGMVNYLAKFVPNMSVKSTNLRKLLLNDVEWQWDDIHANEWRQLKGTLTCEPVLTFFDPKLDIKVSSDASKGGLGAVLLQKHELDWKPIAYASRSMTSAEKNYAQIEKELLGIVYAVEKFHEYVYGTTAIAETDHKPLVTLHQKNLCDLTPRLQRLMLRLRRYDLTLQYTPGKQLVVADTLSRAYPSEPEPSRTEKEIELHVAMVKSAKPISDTMWQKIAIETEKDDILKEVVQAIQLGWDTKRNLKPYYHNRAELTVVEGVVLKGHKIVVPATLRAEMLTKIHDGHMGMQKCQARARGVVYWPQITRDIENMCSKCSVCLKYRYKQPKEPLQPHEIPMEPWTKVGADIFHLHGKNFLIVTDYTSNYPEVAKLEDLYSHSSIKRMKSMFSRHGIPRIVVTDPGSQFHQCKDFRDFANAYGFQHVVSSPKHSQSNGKAEKGVQIVKRLFKKAKESQQDPFLALLSYRTTPLKCGKSPAEILMNRKLRDRMPNAEGYEKSKWVKPMNNEQKYFYDRGAKLLKPIGSEDTVRVKREKNALWKEKAKVLEQVAPRSFRVLLENGQVLRRNRQDLLKTNETFQSSPEPEIPDIVQQRTTETVPTRTTNTEPRASVNAQPSTSSAAIPRTNTAKVSSRGRVIKQTKRLIEEK